MNHYQETIAATHGAMQAAYIKRKEHAGAIAEDISTFEAAGRELEHLRSELLR